MRAASVIARFLLASGTLAPTAFAQTVTSPQQFLELWGKAWDTHDVESILSLQTPDCVMVNRFGVIASGKDEIRRSMAWLHNGPFHNAHFASPKLIDQRKIGPNLVLLHASWKNPSGRGAGTEDDLVMTVVLHDFGTDGWTAEEIDTHAVEPLAPATTAPETNGTR